MKGYSPNITPDEKIRNKREERRKERKKKKKAFQTVDRRTVDHQITESPSRGIVNTGIEHTVIVGGWQISTYELSTTDSIPNLSTTLPIIWRFICPHACQSALWASLFSCRIYCFLLESRTSWVRIVWPRYLLIEDLITCALRQSALNPDWRW